jgi:hypothetical protein
MISSNQSVIRHKYRNQLLATPPSKEIKVLMISNNPHEMGCLNIHLRNFRWKRFAVNTTFDLTEGWKVAQYFKPDYILIEGSFSKEAIKDFISRIRTRKHTAQATIALLKENNHNELLIPGIQDYLLKDNIVSDTFAFDILNAISLKIQEDAKRAFQLSGRPHPAWIANSGFYRKRLSTTR